MKSRQINHIAALFALSLGLVLTGPQAVWAAHSKSASGVDPTPISGCGTYSANNTIYVLTESITQTTSGTCITIGGNNESLQLEGFNITGKGTGAGILITGQEDVIEGSGGTISGFAEGVLDEGQNTAGDDVDMDSNGIGLEMTQGSSGGTTQIWTNFDASNNTSEGVYLNGCNDECTISDFFVSGNGQGVLVTGSEGPRLSVFIAENNIGDGVHVGCVSGCGRNTQVKIGDAPEGATVGAPAVTENGGDGIFLDASESSANDQIFLINASGNGTSGPGSDLHDATSACGDNHWFDVGFGTANVNGVVYDPASPPACIPFTAF